MFLVGRHGEPGEHMKNKAFVKIAGQFSAGGIVAAAYAMVFQRCMQFPSFGLAFQKVQLYDPPSSE